MPRGRAVRRPRKLGFPLIVKSLTLDASIGISQASVVEDDEKLEERVALHPREHRHRRHRRALHRGPRALRRRPRQPAPAGAADLGAELREHARGGAPDRHRAGEVEPELPEEARHRQRPREGPAGAAGRDSIGELCKRVYRSLDAERLRAHRPAPRATTAGSTCSRPTPTRSSPTARTSRSRPRRPASTTSRCSSASCALGLAWEPGYLG